MDEVESYPGQTEVDLLWHEHVGSRHMFINDELERLQYLDRTRTLPQKTVFRLYITSKQWQKLRRIVLNRDEHKCVRCSSTVNLHVDHMVYRELGAERIEDLQTLCHECHANKTKRFDMAAISPAKPLVLFPKGRQLFTVLREESCQSK